MEKEIAKVATMESASNLNFMKTKVTATIGRDATSTISFSTPSVRESVLNQATQKATNEVQALYGDQTELNQCVGMLHRWMIKYRPERMQDGEFTQWLSNANEMGKIFKSPVNNSEPYTSFAAGIGIAAECAAKEDTQ